MATRSQAALKRIRSARDEVRSRLASVGSVRSGDGPPIEAMDGVQAAVTTDADATVRRVLEARLQALAEAEARLRDGCYGVCEACRESIPARRLEALPEARCCLACAEAAEAGGNPKGRGRHGVLAAA